MKWFVFLIGILGFQTGCATIFNNEVETVKIHAAGDHPVKVRLETPEYWKETKLPYTYEGKPSFSGELKATVIDECYEERRMMAEKQLNNMTLINLLFWPGFIVDLISGAFWDYPPYMVLNTRYKESETCLPPKPSSLNKASLDKPVLNNASL